MSDILKMINEALARGFADEEIADLVNAIQDENRAMMERRARTFAAFSGKPKVLLGGQPAWDLGNHRYAMMTPTGAYREVTLHPMAAKPRRF